MNELFKALSDPTRREIIERLKLRDMSAGEIASHFNMTKPSISHHLNILKQADLVYSEKQGQNVIYSLNATVFQEVMGWVLKMINRGETDEA